MSVVSLSRRIEKLEAIRGASDVAAMSDEEITDRLAELQSEIGLLIDGLGGKEAAVETMRAAGATPVELQLIEDWMSSWHQ